MSGVFGLLACGFFIGAVLGFGFGKVHENRRMNLIYENRETSIGPT